MVLNIPSMRNMKRGGLKKSIFSVILLLRGSVTVARQAQIGPIILKEIMRTLAKFGETSSLYVGMAIPSQARFLREGVETRW